MKNTKRIIVSALLTAVSLALFSIELFIPPFPFCPAAKIGLANIVVLFMLINKNFFRTSDYFLVLIARCILSALITGRVMSVLFSLSGGMAALGVMLLMRRLLGEKSIVGISVSGAVSHNIAQIIIAVFIYGTFSAFYYIPALFLAGVLCGILTGLCVRMINHLNLHKRFLS